MSDGKWGIGMYKHIRPFDMFSYMHSWNMFIVVKSTKLEKCLLRNSQMVEGFCGHKFKRHWANSECKMFN